MGNVAAICLGTPQGWSTEGIAASSECFVVPNIQRTSPWHRCSIPGAGRIGRRVSETGSAVTMTLQRSDDMPSRRVRHPGQAPELGGREIHWSTLYLGGRQHITRCALSERKDACRSTPYAERHESEFGVDLRSGVTYRRGPRHAGPAHRLDPV